MARNIAVEADLSSIKAVCAEYFQGRYHGDAGRLRKQIHEKAVIAGHEDDAFHLCGRDDFIDLATKRPSPDQTGEPYDMSLEQIDRTASTAVVRLRAVSGGRTFTEHLSLVKEEGRWTIVARIFRRG